MTDGPRRGRRRLLVPALGLGIAAWAVHRRVAGRPDLTAGWERLPPAPRPVPVTTPRPATPTTAAAPAADLRPIREPAPEGPVTRHPGAGQLPFDEPAAGQLPFEEPVAQEPVAEEPAAQEPVAVHARAVPAAAGLASVTAPALPDQPYGAGSLRALADGSSPDPAYVVKGKTATKVFHAPGGAYYTRTRADVWFRTARDARTAGFTERARRNV